MVMVNDPEFWASFKFPDGNNVRRQWTIYDTVISNKSQGNLIDFHTFPPEIASNY